MNYPQIKTIDDVLPHIDDNFRITTQGQYTYINYNLSNYEVFPDFRVMSQAVNMTELLKWNRKAAIRRECRGIAFDKDTGEVVSRPFHKFFNHGERLEEVFTGGYTDYEKLDGSMVRPLPNGRWATKAGVTDVAMMVEEHFGYDEELNEYNKGCFKLGLTPIYEFTSPNNKIVLEYDKPELTILAVRDNYLGRYLPRYNHLHSRKVHKRNFNKLSTTAEGIVRYYDEGGIEKFKTDWYVQAHKGKELINNERNLIKLYLDNKIDDILPTLLPEDRLKVNTFLGDFKFGMAWLKGHYSGSFKALGDNYDRKKYATMSKDSKYVKAAVFKQMDGVDVQQAVLNRVRKGLQSLKEYAIMKEEMRLT